MNKETDKLQVIFTTDDTFYYEAPDITSSHRDMCNLKDFFATHTVTEIIFIPPRGLKFWTHNYYFNNNDPTKERVEHLVFLFKKPTLEALEYLVSIMPDDKKITGQLWFSALKYSYLDKKCNEFWQKYKNTKMGSQFMALEMGSKL